MSENKINNTVKRNADFIVEIAAWVVAADIGRDYKKCMKRIKEAMEREGYLAKEIKRNG